MILSLILSVFREISIFFGVKESKPKSSWRLFEIYLLKCWLVDLLFELGSDYWFEVLILCCPWEWRDSSLRLIEFDLILRSWISYWDTIDTWEERWGVLYPNSWLRAYRSSMIYGSYMIRSYNRVFLMGMLPNFRLQLIMYAPREPNVNFGFFASFFWATMLNILLLPTYHLLLMD